MALQWQLEGDWNYYTAATLMILSSSSWGSMTLRPLQIKSLFLIPPTGSSGRHRKLIMTSQPERQRITILSTCTTLTCMKFSDRDASGLIGSTHSLQCTQYSPFCKTYRETVQQNSSPEAPRTFRTGHVRQVKGQTWVTQ